MSEEIRTALREAAEELQRNGLWLTRAHALIMDALKNDDLDRCRSVRTA
ncbi:MAG: hypothetical protein GY953_42195 [bacterium]|nr:hypothetical protein [bacterium]